MCSARARVIMGALGVVNKILAREPTSARNIFFVQPSGHGSQAFVGVCGRSVGDRSVYEHKYDMRSSIASDPFLFFLFLLLLLFR